MLKIALSFFVLLNLTHCAFSKEDNPGAKKEEETRNKLINTFNSVVGNYSGKLITSDKEYPVSLRVYILYLPDGKNESGFEVSRPVLRASYYQLTPPKPQLVFNVTYKSEYQTLQMINAATTPLSDSIVSVDAQISGENIFGTASRANGPVGRLELSLQDRSGLAPSEGDSNKYKEDLRNYFQKISGEYIGNVTPDPRKGFPYEIIIKLSTPAAGDNSNPELRGFFIRTDTEELNLCNGRVNVTYLNEYTPPKILIESPAELKTSPCYISIDGTLGENIIQGLFFDREGDSSPIKLLKK